MLDHGLHTQVDAALRHALALTGPEQYHQDCSLVLEVVLLASRLGITVTFDTLAQDVLVVGFPDDALLDQTPSDMRLMMALEAVNDILEGHRLNDLLSGVLGMARWLYVCLQNGDRGRLRAMAATIQRRAHSNVTTVQVASQELH